MSTKGFQQYMKTGNAVIFHSDPIDGVAQDPRDLGSVTEAISPSTNTEVVDTKDTRGGIPTTVDEGVTSQSLQLGVTFSNLNPENFSLINNGGEILDHTQSATEVTGVDILGRVGGLFALVDANGNRLYNVASVTGVQWEAVAVAADDWEASADLLRMGYMKILPGGTAGLTLGDAGTLTVDITPNAITGKRKFRLLERTRRTGYFEVFFDNEDYADQWVFRFYGSMTTDDPAFSATAYSTGLVSITALVDEANPDAKYGEAIKTVGLVPAINA